MPRRRKSDSSSDSESSDEEETSHHSRRRHSSSSTEESESDASSDGSSSSDSSSSGDNNSAVEHDHPSPKSPPQPDVDPDYKLSDGEIVSPPPMTKVVSLTTDPEEQSDGECSDTPDVPVSKRLSTESEADAVIHSPDVGGTHSKYRQGAEDKSHRESPSSSTNEQHYSRKSSSEERPERYGQSSNDSPSPITHQETRAAAQHKSSPKPESVTVSSSVHRVREPPYSPPGRHDMRQFESESESGELSASDEDETKVKSLRSFVQRPRRHRSHTDSDASSSPDRRYSRIEGRREREGDIDRNDKPKKRDDKQVIEQKLTDNRESPKDLRSSKDTVDQRKGGERNSERPRSRNEDQRDYDEDKSDRRKRSRENVGDDDTYKHSKRQRESNDVDSNRQEKDYRRRDRDNEERDRRERESRQNRDYYQRDRRYHGNDRYDDSRRDDRRDIDRRDDRRDHQQQRSDQHKERRDGDTAPREGAKQDQPGLGEDSRNGMKRKTTDDKKDSEPVAEPAVKKSKLDDVLTTRTGGAYIPPAKLRMMQAQITDKSSTAYQRISWEALKKSINGLINKANVSNIIDIVRELFQENIVRGRGILARAVIQAQSSSMTFSHVFAALVSIINTKFPQIGELILRRLIIQFRRGFKRNDKSICLSATGFIGHLVNQQVAHEVLSLEILTLLLENPTDDSVEVAVGFLKECGLKLTEISPRGINAIFERLRNVLHEGLIDIRVQYMVEVMFQVRKDGFKDHPTITDDLDLVDENDQFTHLLTLEDVTDGEDILNVFKADNEFTENEEKYRTLKKEILEESSGDEDDSSGDESGSDDESDDEAEAEKQKIIDETETNLVALRRTIYLTIQSSLDFEECAHKMLKINLKPGQEVELCNMVLDCCAQQRTYEKFFGLLGQRFCQIDKKYIEPYERMFQEQYDTIHRLETNKLRNVAKFFAHLLHTDAISWGVLSCMKMNEDDTTSASRIFIKYLIQELSEYMGLKKLNDRLHDPTLREYFEGLLPMDHPRNTRFAINFFTTIGLGGLTDELRDHLKNMPKQIMQQKQAPETADSSSSSSSSDSSSDSDSSDSSDSSSSNSSSGTSDSDTDSSSADSSSPKKRKSKAKTAVKQKPGKTKHSDKQANAAEKNKGRRENVDRDSYLDPWQRRPASGRNIERVQEYREPRPQKDQESREQEQGSGSKKRNKDVKRSNGQEISQQNQKDRSRRNDDGNRNDVNNYDKNAGRDSRNVSNSQRNANEFNRSNVDGINRSAERYDQRIEQENDGNYRRKAQDFDQNAERYDSNTNRFEKNAEDRFDRNAGRYEKQDGFERRMERIDINDRNSNRNENSARNTNRNEKIARGVDEYEKSARSVDRYDESNIVPVDRYEKSGRNTDRYDESAENNARSKKHARNVDSYDNDRDIDRYDNHDRNMSRNENRLDRRSNQQDRNDVSQERIDKHNEWNDRSQERIDRNMDRNDRKDKNIRKSDRYEDENVTRERECVDDVGKWSERARDGRSDEEQPKRSSKRDKGHRDKERKRHKEAKSRRNVSEEKSRR